MKRFNLKYLSIFFLIVFVCITNTSCKKCKKENRILDKPTNVIFDDKEILSWKAVKNATVYIVCVDDKEYITENTEYDLFNILNQYKTYRIGVYAKDKSGKYLESDTFEIEYEVKSPFNIEYKKNVTDYEIVKQKPSDAKGKIIIPEIYSENEVTRIANAAFENCTGITGVILPETIDFLGTSVFSNCQSLVRVTLPSNITKIPNATFKGCTSLIDFKVPEGVHLISDNAFLSCTNLESIYLPSTFELSKIGHLNAFKGCPNLKTIIVDENNPEYYSDMNCVIKKGEKRVILGGNEVTIPDYIDTIGEYAFAGRNIKMLNLKSIKVIGNSAFENCPGLTDIDLEQVETIGKGTFFNCPSLTNFQAKQVERIGEKAFSACPSLTDIYLEGVKVIGSECFSNCQNLTNIQLVQVERIGEKAFLTCLSLADIHLEQVEIIGDYAFSKCKNLKNVYFSKRLKTIGSNPFLQSLNVNIIIDNTKYCIEGNCLIDKEELSVISGFSNSIIPDYIKEIKDYAFSYCSFETIILPASLELIGEYAFYGNDKLDYITIPSSVQQIKKYAFITPKPNIMSVIFDEFTGILEQYAFYNHTIYTTTRRRENPTWIYGIANCIDLGLGPIYNCELKEENGEKYVYAINLEPANPEDPNILCQPDLLYKICHRKGYRLVGLSKDKDSSHIDVSIQELHIYDSYHFYGFVGKDINDAFPEGGTHTLYIVWEKE